MASGTIDVGDLLRLSVVFTSTQTGASVDPTTVVFKIKLPDGTSNEYTYPVDPEITRSSSGHYYTDYLASIDGVHYYKWTGTGSGQACEESNFLVKTSLVG